MSVFADKTTLLRTSGAPAPTKIWVETELDRIEREVPFKMPNNPPIFSEGVGVVPLLFLAELDSFLVFNGVALENWALVLAQCLRGGAASWFNAELREWTDANRRPTAHTVKEAFLRRFLGQNWQEQVRSALSKYTFEHAGGDLHSFVSKVQQLNGYLEDRSDADRVHHFMERLPTDIARHVRLQGPKSFRDTLSAALTFCAPQELTVDQLLGGASSVRKNDNQVMYHAPGAAQVPAQYGHVTSYNPPPAVDVPPAIPSPPLSPPPVGGDIEMNALREELQALRREVKAGRGGKGGQFGGRGGKGGRTQQRTCFACGGVGHMQFECPSASRGGKGGKSSQ